MANDDQICLLNNTLFIMADEGKSSMELRDYLIENNLMPLLNQTTPKLYPPFENSILHHVFASEDIKCFNLIIDAAKDYINPNVLDSEKKNILIFAAKMRKEETALKLLSDFKGRININHTDEHGRTALHYACALGNINLVKALIELGADTKIRDITGLSPYQMTFLPYYEIRFIYNSVGIDPYRDLNALTNTFHVNDVSYLQNTENYQKIVNKANSFEPTDEMDKKQLEFALAEAKRMTGVSLLATTLVFQALSREYLNSIKIYDKDISECFSISLSHYLLTISNDEFKDAVSHFCQYYDIARLEEFIQNLKYEDKHSVQLIIKRLFNESQLIRKFVKDENELDSIVDFIYPYLSQHMNKIENALKNSKLATTTEEKVKFFLPVIKPLDTKDSIENKSETTVTTDQKIPRRA